MSTTTIEWTDVTWNPVRGCELVSPGCTNCYAMKTAHRFSGVGQPYEGLAKLGARGPMWTGSARAVPDMLAAPLSWKKPRRVFVNSMSDLFHDDVPNDFIAAVFGVMAACPQHTFQVLTKRPERMRAWFEWLESDRDSKRFRHPEIVEHAAVVARDGGDERGADRLFGAANAVTGRDTWPLPNVWLGVSVEDQKRADERIPALLAVPAKVRFLSCEPLLGAVDLSAFFGGPYVSLPGDRIEPNYNFGIHWVIVGGESGPGARPFDVAWARSLVRQCRDASVPVFVKQLGARPETSRVADQRDEGAAEKQTEIQSERGGDDLTFPIVGLRDRKGGSMEEWPADLRVREFPEVPHA